LLVPILASLPGHPGTGWQAVARTEAEHRDVVPETLERGRPEVHIWMTRRRTRYSRQFA